jgi:hypothetical protein
MLSAALTVGSARPKRFADTPTRRVVAGTAERSAFRLDVLDRPERNLAFFNEPRPPGGHMGAQGRAELDPSAG